MSSDKAKRLRSPRVGDKIHGSIVTFIQEDESRGVFVVTVESRANPGSGGTFTLPLSYLVEETAFDEFEVICKPLIKWINDNANPHAIIVIDGTSAVLYSGEKSVLTDEFIKD